ncbi:hypothetical protein [Herbaspirillum rubrisubalbicans]|nr:hypothetical protein [Herbaspirillum rubrisubalbicans]
MSEKIAVIGAVLPAEQLAERARWRDNRLMGLIAHQRQQPK